MKGLALFWPFLLVFSVWFFSPILLAVLDHFLLKVWTFFLKKLQLNLATLSPRFIRAA